jgi:hypothetical protein
MGEGEATLGAWGDVELIFLSCTRARMNFFSEIDGVQGEIELQRLTPVTTCTED